MLAPDAALEIFDEIDSTMLEARRRAERGEWAPVWLMARTQSAGRGRRGRSWTSIRGNLMTTYLGPATAPPGQVALLGLAAALAICTAIDVEAGANVARVKWPNDVYVREAKAAGVMLDSGGAPGAAWFALGFGVNIVGAPEGLDQPTASLRDVTPAAAALPTPEGLLARIRTSLEAYARQLETQGFEPLRRLWLERALWMGRTINVQTGAASIEGVLRGLSANGELEIDTKDGPRRIAAGDVFLTA